MRQKGTDDYIDKGTDVLIEKTGLDEKDGW